MRAHLSRPELYQRPWLQNAIALKSGTICLWVSCNIATYQTNYIAVMHDDRAEEVHENQMY
jgi:hypothetical protein